VNATPAVHIVDDDLSMRTSLARLLDGAGYPVALYPVAEALLDAAGRDLAGCVLLDLRLPGIGGLDLQDQLASRGCSLPVIFLTAYGDVAVGVRAMKHGAVDFLQKPVQADDLFAAVSTAMARDADARRLRHELDALRRRVEALTERERDVWLRVVGGALNKQIAYDLGIVERTVKLHRAAAMEKLGATSLADLIRIAERLSLIPSSPAPHP
jgi:FixJ family two-component response regulator